MNGGLMGPSRNDGEPFEEVAYKAVGRATLPQRLRQQKIHLEAKLAEIDEAIKALEANPEIERVLGLISKVYP